MGSKKNGRADWELGPADRTSLDGALVVVLLGAAPRDAAHGSPRQLALAARLGTQRAHTSGLQGAASPSILGHCFFTESIARNSVQNRQAARKFRQTYSQSASSCCLLLPVFILDHPTRSFGSFSLVRLKTVAKVEEQRAISGYQINVSFT